MTALTPSVSDIDLFADNTLATIAMLSDPLFPLAYPATDACPCCGDVGYTAVRNGDDDCQCPLCGGACDERAW